MYALDAHAMSCMKMWDWTCSHCTSIEIGMSCFHTKEHLVVDNGQVFRERPEIETWLKGKIGNGNKQVSTLVEAQEICPENVLALFHVLHLTYRSFIVREALATVMIRQFEPAYLMSHYGTMWSGQARIHWKRVNTIRFVFKVSNSLCYELGVRNNIPRETEKERTERLARQLHDVAAFEQVAIGEVRKNLIRQKFFPTTIKFRQDRGESPYIECLFQRQTSFQHGSLANSVVDSLFSQHWNLRTSLSEGRNDVVPAIEIALDHRQDSTVPVNKKLFLTDNVLDVG